MEALRDETGETVMLVAIEDARRRVREVVESRHALRIAAPVGSEARVVGAPVLAADGYPLAALIVCGPSSRVTKARFPILGEQIVRATKILE